MPSRSPCPPRLAALAQSLAAVSSQGLPIPTTGRVAAVAVLLRTVDGTGAADLEDLEDLQDMDDMEDLEDMELVLTRRRNDLLHHPGQVALPGGRIDPGESPVAAALREASEEVDLQPSTARPLGLLPAFYIPPSRFWLHPVVLHWERPHPLRPADAEVAEIFSARLSQLTDPQRWRVVELSARGASWAWELDEGRVLWGATGVAVASLLDLLRPGWSAGLRPADLGEDRRVRPWELLEPSPRRPAKLAALGALPERLLADAPRAGAGGGFATELVQPAGEAVARAVAALLPAGPSRRVTVLTGPGGTGLVGCASAMALARQGCDVVVVPTSPPGAQVQRALRSAGVRVDTPGPSGPSGAVVLPEHDLVVDALLGTGFEPPLRGAAHELVGALRASAAPHLAVDVPTGLHAVRGAVGDAVAADVTVSILAAGRLLGVAGVEPFVGDCYLWQPGNPGLQRLLLR